MVADTRPALIIKNRAEGHSLKNIQKDLSISSSRKSEILGVRKSNWEVPSKKMIMIPSRPVTKSQNLEKEMPLLPPPLKTKSQGVKNHVTSTPLNRSDKGKNPISSSHLRRREESLSLTPLNSVGRKEKIVNQVTMESKKAEVDPEKVNPKRKGMTARGYLAQVKRQRLIENEPESSSCNDQSKRGDGGGSMSGGSSLSYKALAEKGAATLDERKNIPLLQLEINKLCQILKLSEGTALATRRFLEYVSNNHHIHSDVPAIMHAFQISLCWAGASISKQNVDKRESLISAKRLLNYQCTEEQASHVYLKMRSLKKVYLQHSESTFDSGRNCLSADDFSKGPPDIVQDRLEFPSLKEKSEGIKVGENSAKDKHSEEQIILQPERTENAKAAKREVNEKIKGKMEKKNKISKIMEKHKQKPENEIQEFLRTWKEKKLQLEEDHKLEAAVIRAIHSQGSVRIEKLKALDDNFSKKIEEHNLLKNLKLKNLKAQQLPPQIQELNNKEILLAEARADSIELKFASGAKFGSESEKDTNDSQSNAHVHIIGTGTVSSASNQHLEIQNERECLSTPLNDTNTSKEAHSCDSPIRISSELVVVNSRDEVTVTPLNTSSSPIPSAIKDGGSQKEIADTSPNEVPGPIQSVESKESQKSLDEEITAAEDLVIQKQASDEAPDRSSLPSGEQLIQSAQTAALPDCTDSSPQRVPQDVLLQDLVPPVLQDQDASTVENHNTSPVPCSTSGIMETVKTVPSNLLLLPADENAVPLLSSNDETSHVAEKQQHCAPVDFGSSQSSPDNAPIVVSSHQTPTVEAESIETVVAQELIPQHGERLELNSNCPVLESGRISSRGQNIESSSLPTMESGFIEMIPRKQISQHRNLEPQGCYAVLESSRIHSQGRNIASSSSPQITASLPQAVENTSGSQNQNVPLGVDADYHRGPNFHFLAPNPTPPQVNLLSADHSSMPDPLQYALEQMQKEFESKKKRREEKMVELQSERDKEILEILKKYEQRFQDVESEFNLIKMQHHIKVEKVRMNMILAKAFRYVSLNPHAFYQVQQAFQSSYNRQLHQVEPLRPDHRTPSHRPATSQPNPNLHSPSHRPGPSQPNPNPHTPSHRPSPSQPTTYPHTPSHQPSPSQPNPNLIPIPTPRPVHHQLSRPYPIRLSPHLTQNLASPQVQNLQQPPMLPRMPGPTLRPPVIGSFARPCDTNPRVKGEIRSRAPHLQSSNRSNASTSTTAITPQPQVMPPQTLPPIGFHINPSTSPPSVLGRSGGSGSSKS